MTAPTYIDKVKVYRYARADHMEIIYMGLNKTTSQK